MNHESKEISFDNQPRIASNTAERIRVRTINTEPSMTQQQFKEECDINNIMKKYGSDPVAFQALTRKGGVFADVTSITDYQSMLHQVSDAQEAFASLPATLRVRFQNDPGQLLSFLQDPKNYDEGVKLGLLEPKKQPEPPAIKNDLNENEAGSKKQKPVQTEK